MSCSGGWNESLYIESLRQLFTSQSDSTSSIEHRQENPCAQELTRFLTRMWEHPLLTPDTIEHRRNLFSILEPFCDREGIVIVPFGSILWVVDSIVSDFDIQVLRDRNYSDSGSEWENYLANLPFSLRRRIHYFGYIANTESLFFRGGLTKEGEPSQEKPIDFLTLLMLTPDIYLLGDLELARRIRLERVNAVNFHVVYDGMLAKFEDSIKVWPWDSPIVGFTGKRERRFQHTLSRRALQSLNMDKYHHHFIEALRRFSLPPLEVWREGINATNGALHLSAKYIAEGINLDR